MQGTFSEWTDRLKVQNEYVKALGEYKIKQAEAALKRAEAANVIASVQAKRFVIKQLQRDLRRYNQERSTRTKQLQQLNRRITKSQLLLRGRRIHTNAFGAAWRSYRWFETRALMANADPLFTIAVPKLARIKSNFLDIREDGRIVDAPADLVNALQLMMWLRENRFITKSGSPAQRVVLKLYEAINKVAKSTREEFESRLKKIRQGTYDAWNLNAILGVSGSSTAKKIASAGTANSQT